MIRRMLIELADTNWFNEVTFIRKLQCSIFGHRHSEKCLLKSKSGKMWCSWCARYIDKLYSGPW